MHSDKENLVVTLSFDFAKEIIFLTEELQENKKFIIANQLIKSGTSIGSISGKRKMQKANLISFTNLSSLQKKQMKQNTG